MYICSICRLLSSYSNKIVQTKYFKLLYPRFYEAAKFYSALSPEQALRLFQKLEGNLKQKMPETSHTLKKFHCKGKTIRTRGGNVTFTEEEGKSSIHIENPMPLHEVSEFYV